MMQEASVLFGGPAPQHKEPELDVQDMHRELVLADECA